MKKAFRNFKLYILGVVLASLGIFIPLGIYWITLIPSLNTSPFPYLYVNYIFGFVFLFIGFTVSDIQIARWRRKNQEYDTKLPQDVKDKAWSIRMPFYLAAAIVLTFCLFFEVWHWIAKAYPLPFNY